jgi:signal peptidase I
VQTVDPSGISEAERDRASAHRERRRRERRLVRDWLMPLALMLLVMLPARSMVADWNDVPTGSMRPTIIEGDRITVNKLAYGLRVPFSLRWLWTWGEPRRGEVVTFASPMDGTRVVKRIVGASGDRIELRNNVLFVNGAPLEQLVVAEEVFVHLPDERGALATRVLEHDIASGRVSSGGPALGREILLTPIVRGIASFPELVVPPHCYFMMGDNRDVSNDSRVYGVVPRANIYGRVDYVALSLDPSDVYWPRWERWGLPVR